MRYDVEPPYEDTARRAVLALGRHLTNNQQVERLLPVDYGAAAAWFQGRAPTPEELRLIEPLVELLGELELIFGDPTVAGRFLAEQPRGQSREQLLKSARLTRGQVSSKRRTLTAKALEREAFAGVRCPEPPAPSALASLLGDLAAEFH